MNYINRFNQLYNYSVYYTAVRRQNPLTLSLEIVVESDFRDTVYNSACVGDVQSLIATIFRLKFF